MEKYLLKILILFREINFLAWIVRLVCSRRNCGFEFNRKVEKQGYRILDTKTFVVSVVFKHVTLILGRLVSVEGQNQNSKREKSSNAFIVDAEDVAVGKVKLEKVQKIISFKFADFLWDIFCATCLKQLKITYSGVRL